MKLYFYEWKKLYLKKNYLIVLISLLILNIGIVCYEYKTNYFDKQLASAEKHYSLMLSGPITEQKVKELNKLIDEVSQKKDVKYYSGGKDGDILVLQDIYEDMYNRFRYRTNINSYLDVVKDNVSYFKNMENVEQEKYNTKLYDEYDGRIISTFDYIVPWENLFNYQNTNVFIGLSLILGLIVMLFVEKESKTESMLYTTQFGRKHLHKIKLLHIISIPVFTVLLFSLSELILFLCLYGFSGFSEPIYAILELARCPIDCSMFEFYTILVGMRILFFTFISLSIFVIYTIFKRKRILISLICLVFIFAMFFLAQDINPLMLLDVKKLFLNGQSIVVFNQVFFKYQWEIIITTIPIILLSIGFLKVKSGEKYEN